MSGGASRLHPIPPHRCRQARGRGGELRDSSPAGRGEPGRRGAAQLGTARPPAPPRAMESDRAGREPERRAAPGTAAGSGPGAGCGPGEGGGAGCGSAEGGGGVVMAQGRSAVRVGTRDAASVLRSRRGGGRKAGRVRCGAGRWLGPRRVRGAEGPPATRGRERTKLGGAGPPLHFGGGEEEGGGEGGERSPRPRGAMEPVPLGSPPRRGAGHRPHPLLSAPHGALRGGAGRGHPGRG